MKALFLLLFVAVFGEDTLVYREEDGNFVEKDELDGDDVQVWFVLDSRTRMISALSFFLGIFLLFPPNLKLLQNVITRTDKLLTINFKRGIHHDFGDLVGIKIDKERNTVIGDWRVWNSTVIPVVLSSTLSKKAFVAMEEMRIEYALATCIDFTPWTGMERDYIKVYPINGCFSLIGYAQQGGQILSIDRGCERTTTMIHEFMHALGINHEQTRPDRDDYITVNYDVIQPPLGFNFWRLGYNRNDVRQVPYDFYSIMHYDQYSFVSGSTPSITTKVEYFNKIIGQRRGFSIGDHQKINHLYKCPRPLRNSVTSGFDKYRFYDGFAPEGDMFEQVEADFEVPGGESYIMEMDGPKRGALISPRYESRAPRQCFSFWYKGSFGDLTVTFHPQNVDGTYRDAIHSCQVIPVAKNEWTYFQCQLEVNEPVIYRIEAGVRSGQKIQLDDVSLVDRECYQEHFQLKNFTNWFAENPSSAFVYSPILKASTGHTYQVKITRGSSSLSTTVYLTNHANDNPDVFWPWVEQYVKIYLIEHRRTPVKDQMNHNYVWLTPDNESSANQKPTSERNPSGYARTFVSHFELFEHYLHRDTLLFMVNITDVRNLNMTSGLDECGACPGIGKGCSWTEDDCYRCICIEPFEEQQDGRCRCPAGFNFVADKQYASDRCVHVCDDPNEQFCGEKETCVPLENGAECVLTKKNSFNII